MATSDEIFRIENGSCEALPARSMRDGLLGKSLEDALQTLLEENPNLIPGKQIAPSSEQAPKFTLLRREMPLSGWSLDHLFVDQYAVPTLVEAKLIQNPESRREVIGQIIEYAANAADLWSEGKARSLSEEYYRAIEQSLTERLLENFGDSLDIDEFWETFEANLAEGRIRLIVAADQIRPEVRRMLEYLNWEMQNVEVYGLEVTCYGNDEHSLIIVPRIIGQSQSTADRKSDRRKSTHWTPDLIESAIQEMEPGVLRDRYEAVLKWALSHDCFYASISKNTLFSAANRYGMRQVGFNIDGSGYVSLASYYYDEDIGVRDFFFDGITRVGLISPEEGIETIKDGRYFSRTLDELTDDEFSWLLSLLEAML